MISNTSLINLFKEVGEYGVSYITTRKLNQDVVENLFSFLKGINVSASNYITALDFMSCLKWYILGKNLNVVFIENRSTENGVKESFLDSSECLTGEIIKNVYLLPNTSCEGPKIDCIQGEVETDLGTARVQISNNSIDLLKQFEFEVGTNNKIKLTINFNK
ncbi:Hypothetical protein CINCED_3A023031 [Cinara cedri]|uniref:Uncharacterized protein n=1 Tax=Cinara cedri TaxID=506608 RepID=A0A5E4N8A3_9HEMI|nr:Hypothetical protein CINCED_3A023031 [Cinara cedri]